MRIIFLDIDGVLIPTLFKRYITQQYEDSNGEIKSKDSYGFIFSSICSSKLNYIIQRTGAKVVIISDWKEHMTLDELRAMWQSRYMSGEIIDVAPKVDTNMRSDSVVKYLCDNQIKDYVIIDDFPKEEYQESVHNNFLHCKSKEGINNDVMFKAIEILSGETPML